MHVWKKRDKHKTEGSREKVLIRTIAVISITERNGAKDVARPGGNRAINK